MKTKNLIVGCGFSGATVARKIAQELSEPVLIIDKKDHVAGNCYDYKHHLGITIHKYGPHIFHTNSDEVWEFLNEFTEWYLYQHEVEAYIDGQQVCVPFNLNSVYKTFSENTAINIEKKLVDIYGAGAKVPILELEKQEDEDLRFLAQYVYEKVFLNYTKKQWGVGPKDIDKSVTSRVPVYVSTDNRYFQDQYQGIPADGYTKLIENMLDHELIEVRTGVDFKEIKESIEYERLIYTGAIDEFFDYEFGELPYRSLVFDLNTCDEDYFQSKAVVNYPNDNDYTRITEFKYFLAEQSDKTIIAKEYPQPFFRGENERYYPILNEENSNLYQKYLDKAQSLENTYFIGRLGDYRYYNIDATIERALEFFENVF